eukprot:scaffold57267_cov71-Phaeocystis_antarctica.AAC.2
MQRRVGRGARLPLLGPLVHPDRLQHGAPLRPLHHAALAHEQATQLAHRHHRHAAICVSGQAALQGEQPLEQRAEHAGAYVDVILALGTTARVHVGEHFVRERVACCRVQVSCGHRLPGLAFGQVR